MIGNLFEELERINERPKPFEFYTARELWTDEHTSEKMLAFHLDKDMDVSSRKADFIDQSVEWIASHFGVSKGFGVADFGCGPGLYSSRLARKQASVTGIDFSRRSIVYAQEVAVNEGLDIRYVNQDYLEFDTKDRFDLILMIMCDFCALSPAQRKEMLARFARLLKPGGSILLDVYSLEAFRQREETVRYAPDLLNGFWSASRYYGFHNTFRYDKEKVVLDKYVIVEPARTRSVYNWLQYFDPDDLEREFAENGFDIEELFGNVAGVPYDRHSREFAVVGKVQEKHTGTP